MVLCITWYCCIVKLYCYGPQLLSNVVCKKIKNNCRDFLSPFISMYHLPLLVRFSRSNSSHKISLLPAATSLVWSDPLITYMYIKTLFRNALMYRLGRVPYRKCNVDFARSKQSCLLRLYKAPNNFTTRVVKLIRRGAQDSFVCMLSLRWHDHTIH